MSDSIRIYNAIKIMGRVISVIVLMHVKGVYAIAVSNQEAFNHSIERQKFVVAMLYNKSKKLRKENLEQFNRMKKAEKDFIEVSKMQQYKAADMLFIRADISRASLQSLPQSFGVSVLNEPVYILFNQGLPIQDSSGQAARTIGFLEAMQLKAFIDKHLYDEIEYYVEDKMERKERERRQARSSMYVGFGGYPWYGYYPYYGGWGCPGGYGYGGPGGFGFGFGF